VQAGYHDTQPNKETQEIIIFYIDNHSRLLLLPSGAIRLAVLPLRRLPATTAAAFARME
jgi:hypothetical protein